MSADASVLSALRSATRGTRVLAAGRRTGGLLDPCVLVAEPQMLHRLGQAASALLPSASHLIAGYEPDSMVLAATCSHITGLPLRLVSALSPTANNVRGGAVEGRTVVMVANVVRSGERADVACRALLAAGARVDALVCAIDAQERAGELLARRGVRLRAIATQSELDGDGWKAMLGGA